MKRGVYNLYVDESGSFGGPEQPSIVCGVLEDTSAGIDWQAARAEMARALPLAEYPFHATVLNTPSAWLAAVLRRPTPENALGADASPNERKLRAVCQPLVELLREVPAGADKAVDALRAALAGADFPDSTTLHLTNAWLRRQHGRHYRALDALTAELRQQVADAFRYLFHRYRHGQLVGLAALARPSGPADRDIYSDDSPGAVRLDAYVRALETLLERVVCLLRGTAACRIDLWVATRYVGTRSFGTLELGRDGIQQLAKRAVTFPHAEANAGAARVRLEDMLLTSARGLVRYDEAAPTGLVVADFLSNRLFHRLRGHGDCSLRALNEAAEVAMSLPLVCAPADPRATQALPTVSADGRARARIRSAYLGEPASPKKLAPNWNREQAAQWIDFARGERAKLG